MPAPGGSHASFARLNQIGPHVSAPAYDVAVVGGGVIGLSSAWHCARRGMSVAVFDPTPGAGASSVAAGMLAPVTEAHYGEEPLLRLNLAAAAEYPRFVAEVEADAGRSAGYVACGTLIVAKDADETAALDELRRYQESLGLEVSPLARRELRSLEPALTPRVRAGVYVEGDHQVDNRALSAALLEACRSRGVALREARVERVLVSDGDARGVMLEGGEEVEARLVLLAAGCWSGAELGLPDHAVPPVRPVKGEVVHLRGEPLISRNVRSGDVYLVPRPDGRLVVGATMEEKGFDRRVTAGAVLELLREAYEVLPGIVELELTETVAGLRPGSPDNAPILGVSALEGLVIASGHHRAGILLAGISGRLIAELIDTGTPPDLMAEFSPQRFRRGDPIEAPQGGEPVVAGRQGGEA